MGNDYLCGSCRKSTNNTWAIQCNKCEGWYHIECIGMRKATHSHFDKEKSKTNGARWVCSKCETNKKPRLSIPLVKDQRSPATSSGCSNEDIMSELKALRSDFINQLNVLSDKIVEQSSINEQFKVEIALLKEEILSIKNNRSDSSSSSQGVAAIVNTTQFNPDNMYSEVEDRMQRSKNLMLYNLEESKSTDFKERINYDQQKVINILSKLDVPDVVVKCIRLGKPNTLKPRPLKILLPNEQTASKCLRMKSRLRSEDSSNSLRMGADLTPLQRSQIRNILVELQDRRNMGESDLVMKFIHGRPTIVSTNSRKDNVENLDASESKN